MGSKDRVSFAPGVSSSIASGASIIGNNIQSSCALIMDRNSLPSYSSVSWNGTDTITLSNIRYCSGINQLWSGSHQWSNSIIDLAACSSSNCQSSVDINSVITLIGGDVRVSGSRLQLQSGSMFVFGDNSTSLSIDSSTLTMTRGSSIGHPQGSPLAVKPRLNLICSTLQLSDPSVSS
jgi:hypothetical protein